MWNVDLGFEIRLRCSQRRGTLRWGDVRFGSRKKGLERVAVFSDAVEDFCLLLFRRSWRSSMSRGVIRELKV